MKISIAREHIPSKEYKKGRWLKCFLGEKTKDFSRKRELKEFYGSIKNVLFRDLGVKDLDEILSELTEDNEPIVLEAYTNGEPPEGKEGFYYTKLIVELSRQDIKYMCELETARNAFSDSWFEFSKIRQENNFVQMDDGTYMIRHLGRYSSGLRILIDIKKEFLKPETIDSEEIGIRPDGRISAITGDFFVSKKGLNFFKVKGNGKHRLIRQNWGGAFNASRGLSLPREGSLYYNRRISRGGGLGITWGVYKKDWTALDNQKEEKVEFHNVKIDLENLYSEINRVDKNRFFFQVNNQSCIGAKIYFNDFRQNRNSSAYVICQKKGDYTEIDIYEEKTETDEPEYLLTGVYLYSNTKNRGASSYIDEDESEIKIESASSPYDTIRRRIVLFVIKKGKKVSLRGRQDKILKL